MLRLFVLNPFTLVRERRYYTLLTSGLIHANLGHLFVNMFTFYFFAPIIEQVLGHWQFLALYVVSLVLSDITTVVKRRDDPNYFCLGASGAVTAVLFSFVVYAPFEQILLFAIVPIPALLYAGLFLAYSYYASRHSQGRINHEAHLWGAISGLLMTFLLDPRACTHFLHVLKITS